MKASKYIFMLLFYWNIFSFSSTAIAETYSEWPFKIHYTANNDINIGTLSVLAERMITAYQTYTNGFELRSPIDSPRYAHLNLTEINIYIVDNLDAKGKAFDVIPKIELRKDIISDSTDLTPEHELFHLFQGGYTLFKTHWFHEGTAWWSEYAFNNSGLNAEVIAANRGLEEPFDIPQRTPSTSDSSLDNSATKTKLFNNQYPVSIYWLTASLAYDDVRFLDTALQGVGFMKEFLMVLSAMDDDLEGKSNTERKSSAHNEKIWLALTRTRDFGGILSNIDNLFNWAENTYPGYFSSHQNSEYYLYNEELYYIRTYSTGNILGVKTDGQVYIKTGDGVIQQLGHLSTFRTQCGCF
ncbi:MAG: hypothetical protein V3V18_14610 [Methylococcales bacterium]